MKSDWHRSAGVLRSTARDVKLRTAARYLAHVVSATLDGSSDVDAILEFAAADPAMKIALREITVRGKDIQVRGPAGSAANFDLDCDDDRRRRDSISTSDR